MKSIRISAYILIALHFLRKTYRKLSQDTREFPGMHRGNPMRPCNVCMCQTNKLTEPTCIALCRDYETACRLVSYLDTAGMDDRTFSVDTDTAIPRGELHKLLDTYLAMPFLHTLNRIDSADAAAGNRPCLQENVMWAVGLVRKDRR